MKKKISALLLASVLLLTACSTDAPKNNRHSDDEREISSERENTTSDSSSDNSSDSDVDSESSSVESNSGNALSDLIDIDSLFSGGVEYTDEDIEKIHGLTNRIFPYLAGSKRDGTQWSSNCCFDLSTGDYDFDLIYDVIWYYGLYDYAAVDLTVSDENAFCDLYFSTVENYQKFIQDVLIPDFDISKYEFSKRCFQGEDYILLPSIPTLDYTGSNIRLILDERQKGKYYEVTIASVYNAWG